MNIKNLLSYIAMFSGEAIIIAAFILFRGSLTTNILVLNIVVSLIIYGLLFLDILVPWIDLGDESGKKVGALGVRWVFTWLYTIAAITVMLVGNLTFEWSFSLQIIFHGVLILFLILGLSTSLRAADKTKEVYDHEEKIKQSDYRKRIEQIKSE